MMREAIGFETTPYYASRVSSEFMRVLFFLGEISAKALSISCHRTVVTARHSGPGIFSGLKLPQAR